jgi:hypothetical protein
VVTIPEMSNSTVDADPVPTIGAPAGGVSSQDGSWLSVGSVRPHCPAPGPRAKPKLNAVVGSVSAP